MGAMKTEHVVKLFVAAYKEDHRLERKINSETTPEQRASLRKIREANQMNMENAAISLVVGVLEDVHRIADALEKLASPPA